MKTPKKVVFFVPSFSSIEATAPLGLLAISTPLIRAGYEVRIIDSTITADYKQRVLDEVRTLAMALKRPIGEIELLEVYAAMSPEQAEIDRGLVS